MATMPWAACSPPPTAAAPSPNRAKVTDPLLQSTQYAYDANGNPISVTDRKGNVVRNSYDPMGRLQQVTAPDGAISFTYDGAGRRLTMTDGTGTTSYAYTAAGRLKQKTAPDGKSIRYSYDTAGQATGVTDFSGAAVSLSYDAGGRLTQVTDADGSTVTYSYDAGGRRSKLMLPGGVSVSYTYDADNRVTQLTNGRSDGSTISHFAYADDALGNVTSRTEGGATTSYSYDAASRLVSYQKPDGTKVSYTYDGAGNRLTETTGSTTKTYTYDANNRLTGITAGATTTSFTYDANGNLLTDGTRTYTYNSLNQLTGISGDVTATYAYNGDGLRVKVTVGGATTNFYWDGDQIGLETDGNGQLIARNLYGVGRIARILGPGSPAYQATGNNRGYYLYDAHGDVRSITDATGTLLASYAFDPWGKLNQHTGTFDNPYSYGGEYQDTATGLYYLRSRFLSPDLGRFLTEDTYAGDPGDPLTLNLYTYVRNNPLSYLDPTGHLPYWASYAWGAVKGAAQTGAVIVAGAVVIGGVALVSVPAAVVLGVGALGYGLYRSYRQRQQEQVNACLWDGSWGSVGRTALASLGDMFGVSGIIEGVKGRRLLTNAHLSAEQAGEQLGGGLVAAGAWVAGGAKAYRARTAGAPEVPTELATDGNGPVRPDHAVRPPLPGEEIQWPPNNGFHGAPVETTLKPGTLIDRYGPASGRFASPKGTPFSARALPQSSLAAPYYVYEVLKPVQVLSGPVEPWFGEPGMGTQYRFLSPLEDLIGEYLREVK